MKRVVNAAETAESNFCARTLLRLAEACSEYAKQSDAPVLHSLALHSFFLGLGNRIDDGPVSTADLDALKHRLMPLLALLSLQSQMSSDSSGQDIRRLLESMRDLIA